MNARQQYKTLFRIYRRNRLYNYADIGFSANEQALYNLTIRRAAFTSVHSAKGQARSPLYHVLHPLNCESQTELKRDYIRRYGNKLLNASKKAKA